MNNKLKTGYFYLEQANKFSIIRVPKDIITGEIFSPLSLQAKLLYGLLIDRMTLSNRNRWLDEENRVYILYPVKEMQKDMGLSKRKIEECLMELDDFGLIVRKHQGNGRPNRIYVMNYAKREK